MRIKPIAGRPLLQAAFGAALLVGLVLTTATPSWAVGGVVGGIHGTLIDRESKAPIADVNVSAFSPAGSYSTKTNTHGFFTLIGLPSDTYTVTLSGAGYEPFQVAGVTVLGDQQADLGTIALSKAKVLGHVMVRASNSAFQPKQTQDVTTISGAQITQALGTSFSANEQELVQSAPGAVVDANGNLTVRGSLTVELGNQFDGVPFDAPFFDENGSQGVLNNLAGGTGGSLQVVSGAGDATQGNVGAGIINIVPPRGTYPGHSELDLGVRSPYYEHTFNFSYGFATPDNRFSNFLGIVGRRDVPEYAPFGVDASAVGQFAGTSYDSRDDIEDNFYYKFGHNQNQSLQVLARYGDFQSLGNYGGLTGAQWYTNPNSVYEATWGGLFPSSGPGSLANLTYVFPNVSPNGGTVTQPEVTAYQPMHFLKIGYTNTLNPTTYLTTYFFNWGLTEGSTNYTVGSIDPGYAEIGGSHVGGIAELTHQFGEHHQVTLAAKLDNAYPLWNQQTLGFEVFDLYLSSFLYGGASGAGGFVGNSYVPTWLDWALPQTPGLPVSASNPCMAFGSGGVPITTSPSDPSGCYIYNYLLAKGLWKGVMPKLPTMGISYHHSDFHEYGLGLRDQWEVNSRLKLDYGLRVDGANFSFGPNPFALDPNGNPSDVNPVTQIGEAFTHPKFWEPRVSAGYQMGYNDSLRVSYGRSVQFFFGQTSGTPADANLKYWNPIFLSMPAKDGLPGSPGPQCGSGWHGPGSGYTSNSNNYYAGSGPGYFFPCSNYASQIFWTWDQIFDAPDLGGQGPPTYNDYDVEWSHQFSRGRLTGWGMKLGFYARRGYNVEQNTLLQNGPANPVTGQVSASTFATRANGIEKVTGIESQITTPPVAHGFSGFLTLNYVNELSNTPPVAGSDVLPILNQYLFSSGLLFRSGFEPPFSGHGGVTYTAHNGLKITPTVDFNGGYPFGVGRTSIGFINGVLYTIPETNYGAGLPFAGPNGPNFPYNSSYYVDPAYPGTILNPNIAASRGYGEPALAGGNLTRPSAFLNISIEQPLRGGLSVGTQIFNVFNNHNGIPSVNTAWQPVADGVGGPQTGLFPGAYPGSSLYDQGARDEFGPAGANLPFEPGYNPGTVFLFYVTSKF